MVKLETIDPTGTRTEPVAGAVFESMVLDTSDACNDMITLRLKGDREIVHEIVEPVRITLQPSGANGDFNPLQIAAENGTYIITFHPAIHARMLEDLKTAQAA